MKTKAESTQESISSFFEQDHREIDALFAALRFEYPAQALPGFEEFDRRLERHIRWEEEIVFPAVSGQAPHLGEGPIRVMRMDHEEIRREKASVLKALREGNGDLARSHAKSMRYLLQEHNWKEEQVLYPSSDRLLPAESVSEILRRVRGE